MEYKTVRNLLFKLDSEKAHGFATTALKIARRVPGSTNPNLNPYLEDYDELKQEILGVEFKNPVGLAAGFDKNAELVRAMEILGFGFVEIGTVTPEPQFGNDKPRLFRHIDQESLQNWMGFNGEGSKVVAKRLKNLRRHNSLLPIGVNVGKNKATSNEEAINDYIKGIISFEGLADYLVVNVSSPNTPNLRDLQSEEFVRSVFSFASTYTKKPVFLKISPDMTRIQAVDISTLAVESGASGIIATNTTVDYDLLKDVKRQGGLSGAVLRKRSAGIFEAIGRELHDKTILISVGGIDSGQEAYKRIIAGARLVQIYTSLIYGGPGTVKKINSELVDILRREGIEKISDAVGSKWS